jgi:pantoate--beta-alanine ligase
VEVTASAARFRELCEEARQGGRAVGLVPTMGAFHGGHASLVERARGDLGSQGFVSVSIFVNPLQFGPGEDLAGYPRRPEDDLLMAEALGCDLAFTPAQVEMYPNGQPEVSADPGPLGARLEGRSRPDHFRGVLTVVAKLFNLTGRCRAYFGQKDAQQLALIRRMATDLDFPVEVVGCPTVREPDGVALSSRNEYLSSEERLAAPALFDALAASAELVRNGERNGDVLRAEMARRIGAEPLARLDYVAVVDDASWEDVDTLRGPARALVAARIGPARLIDNLLLPWDERWTMHNNEG